VRTAFFFEVYSEKQQYEKRRG